MRRDLAGESSASVMLLRRVWSPALTSSTLRLLQVQHSSDEEAASAQRRQPSGEAPPSPPQGGVSPRETAAAETGRLAGLTQLDH